MLPPTPVGTIANSCPPNTMLIYSGATTGQAAINCVPVKADQTGNVSTSGTVQGNSLVSTTSIKTATLTASGAVAASTVNVGGSTATSGTVDTANALATVLSTCGKAGGGTLQVDASGNITCGPVSSVTYVTNTTTEEVSAPAPAPVAAPAKTYAYQLVSVVPESCGNAGNSGDPNGQTCAAGSPTITWTYSYGQGSCPAGTLATYTNWYQCQ